MDFPLAIFLPHALVARQAGLLPGRELVGAGGSDTEQLFSLEMPGPEENGQCGGGSIQGKFTAWCHLQLLQGSKLWGNLLSQEITTPLFVTSQAPRDLPGISGPHTSGQQAVPCSIPDALLQGYKHRQHFPKLLLWSSTFSLCSKRSTGSHNLGLFPESPGSSL